MKNLADFDPLYKENIVHLPKEDRIEYCENYMNKITNLLAKSGHYMDSNLKQKLQEMIDAAKQEILSLKK